MYSLDDKNENIMHSIATLDLWHMFQFAELIEIMRQNNDKDFIDILNEIRVGNVDTSVKNLLCSRFISPNNRNYPSSALHIFAENSPVRKHNEKMLQRLATPLVFYTFYRYYSKKLLC